MMDSNATNAPAITISTLNNRLALSIIPDRPCTLECPNVNFIKYTHA